MILDFKYSDEDELPWETARPAAEAYRPARSRRCDLRPVSDVARAVAVGAVPVSELRRLLESLAQGVDIDSADPADVCGGEDSGCTSFLDRYLGGGADPGFLEEADLFKAI